MLLFDVLKTSGLQQDTLEIASGSKGSQYKQS